MTVFSTTSDDGESPSEGDPLNDLARFLRQGVGQEWRAEMEATEFEIHQHRLRGRTLPDVTTMLLHRGDRVTILAGSLQFAGKVVACGKDYLTLESGQVRVDACLQKIGLVVAKGSSGGAQASGVAPTWRALLAELELSGEPVQLYGASLGRSRQGTIRVVSADHIWLVEPAGLDSYLPLEEVSVVIRRHAKTVSGTDQDV